MQVSNSKGLFNDFTNALGQQLFFWGCDVNHPEGNLLCEFGFDRRKSHGVESTSCYQMNYKGHIIELHGHCCGCYSKDKPGFLFTRYPRQCWLYEGHEPPPPGRYDKTLMSNKPMKLLEVASREFLEWWLEYEAWIENRTDDDYRQRCYQAYRNLPKSKVWLPPSDALSWLQGFMDSPESLVRAREWKKKSA